MCSKVYIRCGVGLIHRAQPLWLAAGAAPCWKGGRVEDVSLCQERAEKTSVLENLIQAQTSYREELDFLQPVMRDT